LADGRWVDKQVAGAIYGEAGWEERVGVSRYFVIFAAVWVAAMTWRIYPQFKDALRIDGRVLTFAEYVEEACGQRIGPNATSCIEEAWATGRREVAREQGKSVLLIAAPLLGYLLVYMPVRLGVAHLADRRRKGSGEAAVK
jgi:hypothetical protein